MESRKGEARGQTAERFKGPALKEQQREAEMEPRSKAGRRGEYEGAEGTEFPGGEEGLLGSNELGKRRGWEVWDQNAMLLDTGEETNQRCLVEPFSRAARGTSKDFSVKDGQARWILRAL